jgi:hypothetical protein
VLYPLPPFKALAYGTGACVRCNLSVDTRVTAVVVRWYASHICSRSAWCCSAYRSMHSYSCRNGGCTVSDDQCHQQVYSMRTRCIGRLHTYGVCLDLLIYWFVVFLGYQNLARCVWLASELAFSRLVFLLYYVVMACTSTCQSWVCIRYT